MQTTPSPLVEVRALSKHFPLKSNLAYGLKTALSLRREAAEKTAVRTEGGPVVRANTLKAVDNISFDLFEGKTTGLVGESGCGKSTVGRLLTGLHQPTSGIIRYLGKDLVFGNNSKTKELRKIIQMIFQDPYGSLDPRKRLQTIINRPLLLHTQLNRSERKQRIIDLLQMVGLDEGHLPRFPFEFSGGQRQRIAIARALAVEPSILICDEPVSALDVSIQARILNLLKDLQQRLNLTYLFISHDLGVIQHVSDRIIVMYLGTISEIADAEELYRRPLHPYTRGLINSAPRRGRKGKRVTLEGDVEAPIGVGRGCRFVRRCPIKLDRCAEESPQLIDVGGNHQVACFNIQEPVRKRNPS
jgi:oligopeptide transport system ATP-binding protein